MKNRHYYKLNPAKKGDAILKHKGFKVIPGPISDFMSNHRMQIKVDGKNTKKFEQRQHKH